jgi:hypothetical protein
MVMKSMVSIGVVLIVGLDVGRVAMGIGDIVIEVGAGLIYQMVYFTFTKRLWYETEFNRPEYLCS